MKILLVTYFIAPLQKIGSVRWTKISKYLKKEYGVQIDVLTMEKDFDNGSSLFSVEKKDSLLEADMHYFDNYVSLKYGFIASVYRFIYYYIREIAKRENTLNQSQDGVAFDIKDIKTTKEEKNILGIKAVDMIKDDIKNNIQFWMSKIKDSLECMDSIKTCIHYIQEKTMDYDVVISTYSPIWTHFVAKKIKKINPGITWIADFRDAYAVDLLPAKEFEKRKTFASDHLKSANAVVKVLEEMNLFLPTGIREYIITNGYDMDEATEPQKPHRFNFVFTGSLYGEKRDLTPLFEAIDGLCREGKIDISDISVDYAGQNGSAIHNMARKFKLHDIVNNYGVIGRKEALKLQSSCAILLLADWNTKENKPCWSGKAYEYMMAKKPIVFIMSGDVPGSLPSRNINKLGGVCYEKANNKETMKLLKQFILEQYNCWKKTGDIFLERDEDYVESFSYKKIASNVWDLLKISKEFL